MKADVQNYLDVKARIERIENIVGGFTIEYQCEKLLPLLADGFTEEEIIDYMAIKLHECANKQQVNEEI
tara:strand:+ start:1119 stop:1325 length:207 start_codon:yes stop_codon:yes gene_type:complete